MRRWLGLFQYLFLLLCLLSLSPCYGIPRSSLWSNDWEGRNLTELHSLLYIIQWHNLNWWESSSIQAYSGINLKMLAIVWLNGQGLKRKRIEKSVTKRTMEDINGWTFQNGHIVHAQERGVYCRGVLSHQMAFWLLLSLLKWCFLWLLKCSYLVFVIQGLCHIRY